MRYKIVLGVFLLTILLVSFTVSARPNYMAAFMQQYDVSDTRLATCAMCHVHPNGGGARDSYGISYSENEKDFLTIEELDSDGDGFTNIEEISSLTFPGDPDDHPEVAEVTESETANADNSSNNTENEIEAPVNTEDTIQTGNESDVESTATEVQSPGFGIVLAVFGMTAAFYAKRQKNE
jgi:hypothetical protein